jgi:hypothetical protein
MRLALAQPDGGTSIYPLFADDAGGKLETKLTAIAREVIVTGEAEHRRRSIAHHKWLLQERERLAAEVARKRAEAMEKALLQQLAEEKARRDHLFGQAQAWRTAQDIRGFVAAVRAAPGDMAPADTEPWAAWALAEADALDPVASGDLRPPGALRGGAS